MPVNVLLLDDLADTRDSLSQCLRQALPDCSILEAETLSCAINLLESQCFDLALIDLNLPDGNGLSLIQRLQDKQPHCKSVVITIHDEDTFLFSALQAGAFGYLLKDQLSEQVVYQLTRINQGEPPLSPAIARRVISYFRDSVSDSAKLSAPEIALTSRESEVLSLVATGLTLQEIATDLGISRYTAGDHLKQIYRKLGISSRAEATVEAIKRGLHR